MKLLLKIVLPVLLLAGGLAAKSLLVATGPQVESREPETYVPAVEVMEARSTTLRLDVHAQGVVRAQRTATFAAEVAGKVVAVDDSLLAGGFFEAGAVLVRIDDTDARIALMSAQARAAQADAALALEQAQGEIARRDWEALGEGDPPPAALRLPQRQAAEAELAAAQAAVHKAEVDLSRCTVVAPFAGRTVRRTVELGTWVGPGQPLVEAYATDAAEVMLPLPLEDLVFLALDVDGADAAPVPVILEAAVGDTLRRWDAQITRVAATLDERDRMVRAVARVEAPFRGSGHALAPGMFVQATLQGRQEEGVFQLPRYVLRGGDTVLVVDAEERLRKVPVQVLQRRTDTVIVRGLTDGDRVCTTTLALVLDGMRVIVAGTEAEQ